MKSCQIWGNMVADHVSDQYPTVVVCDECAKNHSSGEDAEILFISEYDPDYGDECHFCSITPEEEAER